jgi:hypothetical protein
MVNPEGGCVTYVGSGGEEFPSTTDNFNAYFFRQINRGRTYGLALAESKVIYGNILSSSYGLYTSHTYSIQGDPSNKPFLREPKNIEVTASGPIRKGKGSVDFTFSIQPEDTVFVTLTEGDRILSAKKTISQNFTIDYQDVTSDSLYLNYYSQECFFKSAKYSTVSAEEISFKIENLTVQDANVSGIAEDGESFGMNFKFTLNSNPAGIDSLVAVVAGSDHSGINIINGQKRFRLPSAGSYTSIGAFSMKFTSPDPVISDSVAVTDLEIRKKDGSVLFAQKVYVPVSVPYLKLHSFERNGNTLSPKFANVRKGKINTAKIDLLEYAKQDLQQDALKFYERATVTLRNITGFKIVSDSVNFDIDSTKIYKLAVTINGGKIYYSGDFGFTSQQEQPVLLYADHSPGKVNLEWKHSFSDVCGVNVYSFQDALLSNPVLRNFERIDGSKFSFIYDTADPVYVSVAFTDSSGYEFYMSQSVRVEPIPLYRNKTYKVAPFQIYNPVFIDGKLISNSLNSSVGGINSDGSYINGTGLVHESGINGFSLNAQQGFAVGDINSDGRQDMVNYSYNMGDSVLVKAIDLTTGDIIAQKKIYGHIMENAPVLANADDDSDLEIFISVFNGNIGGTPAKGSYVYMLDYNAGSFDIAPGFPIFSSASSYTIHSPSVLDLNNDGTKELIFNCGVKILVYSVQGPAKIAEYSLPKTINTSLSFCDIDSDGDLEIFALTESYGTYGKLFALSFNGTSLSVLPETSGGLNIDMKNQAFLDLTPPVSFADINGDGQTEIISVTASKIYIYNDDFSNYGNFPVPLDARVTENNLSAPSIADFDGDGRLDILFMDSNYRIWCYSGSSGGILPGFPLQIKDMDRDELTSPAVADLDGDGDLEFAIGTRDGVMIVYDYPYKSSGMPVLDNYRGDLYNSGLFTPLVPSSPGNVSISVSGQGIMLSWDAVPGVSSYSVYSSDNPYGNFVYEGQSAGPDYTVYGLTENKKFFYIKAVR